MTECPICGDEDAYDGLNRSCEACGTYDESLAHGTLARERREAYRRIAERRDRGR